jgi:hypothetical protein
VSPRIPRALISVESDETLRSMGPLVGALAATTAVVFLVWNMFAEVRASAPGD